MKIAIDISPLIDQSSISHRVRGTGFYISNLKRSLLEYFPDNQYTFFSRKESVPNVDIIHYPYFEPFFLSLPVIKKNKFVVTVHDLTPLVFPKEFPYGYKGLLKWNLQKVSLKRATAIITDSEVSRKDIIKYAGIPDEKINVIYLAASDIFKRLDQSKVNNLQKEIGKKYDLPKQFVLYVGDVTWNKNLPRLIEAVRKAKVSLVMVGKALSEKNFDRKNPWNKDLVAIQEQIKKTKLITCIGFVSTEDLVLLYNMATVFVMPSLYEGFGLPVLEAMQCGCPVVTTKEGSLPEVAGNASIYCNAYNIDSIADSIKKVFSDEKLQKRLSENGLKQSKKFSWRKVAQETISVYEKTNTSSY